MLHGASVTARRSPSLRVGTVVYTLYETDSRVMRYVQSLIARGHRVDVIGLRKPGQPASFATDGITLIGVQTRRVNEKSPLSHLFRILLFFFRTMLVLSWRQLRFGYDVVHIHSVPDFLVFTAWLPKLMGAKIILDIHDILPELYASKFGVATDSIIVRMLIWTERASGAYADHVITPNDIWHEKLIERSVPSEKATALVNYPDLSIFYPRERTRRDGKFIIIYPGTLNWHQGLDVALHAFAKIKDRAPQAEFHIYGAGPALPALACLSGELGLQDRVHFNSILPLHEIAQVIAEADLGIVPKRADSFGNEAFSTKILEFMAVGVPVIVSETKIDSYYFNESMVRFFEAGNVDDLAKAMLELIKDRSARESLIREAWKFVDTNSWQAKEKIYLDIVDSLV